MNFVVFTKVSYSVRGEFAIVLLEGHDSTLTGLTGVSNLSLCIKIRYLSSATGLEPVNSIPQKHLRWEGKRPQRQ